MSNAAVGIGGTRGTAVIALAATLWIQAVVAWAILTIPTFAPSAAAELGLSTSQVGWYAGIVYLGAMTAALLGGGLVTRFGAIGISQAGMLLCALGLFSAVTGWIWAMALGALVLGFGYGPTTPASSHVLARHTPAHMMSLVFSIKQTGVPLGGMLAGITVPPLTLAFGWRGAAAAVALVCVATALAVQVTRARLDDDRRPDEPMLRGSPWGPVGFVLKRADLRLLALTSMVFAAVQQCLAVFLVSYLTGEVGLGLVAAGLMLSVSQAGGIGGRIVWGWIADRVKNSRAVLGCLALAMGAFSALLASVAQSWPTPAIAAVVLAFGLTGSGWNGVALAEVARLATPAEAGRATGGMLFLTFLGVVLAPPILAELARHTGGLSVMYLVLAALTLPCAAALLRKQR